MSAILFYSEHCPHSLKILQKIQHLSDVKLFCLDNVDHSMLPRYVKHVPSLRVSLNDEVFMLKGKDLEEFIETEPEPEPCQDPPNEPEIDISKLTGPEIEKQFFNQPKRTKINTSEGKRETTTPPAHMNISEAEAMALLSSSNFSSFKVNNATR